MILEFSSGVDKLLYAIGYKDGERILSIAAHSTGFIFLPVTELHTLKKMSEAELMALEDTVSNIVKAENDEQAKEYVVLEMKKLGFKFKGFMSKEEYLEGFKSGGFRI